MCKGDQIVADSQLLPRGGSVCPKDVTTADPALQRKDEGLPWFPPAKEYSPNSDSLSRIQQELDRLGGGIYRLDRVIGKGSYGVVLQAYNMQTEKKVAIKRISPYVFKDAFLSLRILREISLMCHFRHRPFVIGIEDVLVPPSNNFEVLYIVMEMMDFDLRGVLKSGQPLTEQHVKFFVYQILCGLLQIHKSGIIHRDLTPANILVDTSCDIKICDFGLARPYQGGTQMTDYVVMRWYRAPELVMEASKYTYAVDIWSCGCILGQLYNKKYRPLFPGKDRIKQLGTILQTIGTPSREDIREVGSEAAQRFIINHHDNHPATDFAEFLRSPEGKPLSDEALDLLSRMLQFNPRKRISVVESLRHPYFKELYDPIDEEVNITPFHLDLGGYNTEDPAVVKTLIYNKVFEIKEILGLPKLSTSLTQTLLESSSHITESTSSASPVSGIASWDEDKSSLGVSNSVEDTQVIHNKDNTTNDSQLTHLPNSNNTCNGTSKSTAVGNGNSSLCDPSNPNPQTGISSSTSSSNPISLPSCANSSTLYSEFYYGIDMPQIPSAISAPTFRKLKRYLRSCFCSITQ